MTFQVCPGQKAVSVLQGPPHTCLQRSVILCPSIGIYPSHVEINEGQQASRRHRSRWTEAQTGAGTTFEMREHWSRTQQRCAENRHQTALESTYGGARTVFHAVECVLVSTSTLYHLCRHCSTPDKSPWSLLKNKDIPTQELCLETNSVVLCAQAGRRKNRISGLLQQAESHWDVMPHREGWYQEMQMEMAQRAPRVCSVKDFCRKLFHR